MTILTLDRGWLLRVDTGELFGARTKDRSQQYGMPDAGIVNHAGGRQRAYSVEGETGSYAFTYVGITLPDVETLRGWKGDTVLYRDHRPGLAMYGVFFEVEVPEWRGVTTVYDARISLGMVTVVEGV